MIREGFEMEDGPDRFRSLSAQWFEESVRQRYSYNFSWLGMQIIQYPQDMVAIQEVLWRVQPSLVIECGIAHGGSLIFHASILELIASCGGPQDARVLGIDIDIREHNRKKILEHPLSKRVDMVEGSSIDPLVVQRVSTVASTVDTVLVILDSNHSHEHVSAELNAYAHLVTEGSYCIVLDTAIERLPDELHADRPWGRGNSAGSAVEEFLKGQTSFEVDRRIDERLAISVGPGGYLLRIA